MHIGEHGSKDAVSNVAGNAMDELADTDEPASLDQIVAADGERMTKAQELIDRMKSQITKGNADA